jgi:acetylornithine deacetylase/succinyl-diaminopimelate desuccinylase-like protein
VRVLERLDELYAIGGGPGANRLGGTGEEDEAHALTAEWMREAGLDVSRDAAGNLLGRLPGRRPDLGDVWTGSHLDTVPAGGRFDGALGVVGGLEAISAIGQQERTLGVVAFRDEEGCSGPGCVGSRALCAAGALPAFFLELHVEQGPRLEMLDAPLAVVSGIAASARGEVVFEGAAGHAGTTPMAARRDALVEAAGFVLQLRDAAAAVEEGVATVGRIAVEPGASNVIPCRVVVSVDVRAPDEARVERMLDVVPAELPRTAAVPMSAVPTAALRVELEARELPVVTLPSGAGHDAGVLAAAGVPTGMLFVRSLNGGVSHSPDEHSDAGDIEQAVAVLGGALRRLAAGD